MWKDKGGNGGTIVNISSGADRGFCFRCELLPSVTVVAERLCSHRCLSVHRWEVYTLPVRHPAEGKYSDFDLIGRSMLTIHQL